jgi:hypothetical protein
MLEANFQRKVLAKLRTIPQSWWAKLNDRTTIGLPDIIGFVGIYGFVLELKTTSRLSEIQYVTLNKIDRIGVQNFVVTPENFDEIFNFIRGYLENGADRKPARFPLWVLPPSQNHIRRPKKGRR